MFTKLGIDTTRAMKNGPSVKQGIKAQSSQPHEKIVTCSGCGKKLRKKCESAMVCEISILKCPNCGCDVN